MVRLPNIPLSNKVVPLRTNTANQYSQLAQEFINIEKYKKADYEKREKEFLEYSYLKPEDLIFANFTKKQGDEIEKRVHKWTNMWAESKGRLTPQQKIEMKLDRQSFDNFQETIQTTLKEYKDAKEKINTDFKGNFDRTYFDEQEKRLINGDLPTNFLESSAKDPIIEGTKLLKDYPQQKQFPVIGKSQVIGNTQYTYITQDYYTDEQKLEVATMIPVQSQGAAKTIFNQIEYYKQNPNIPIVEDSKKRTLNQLLKEYDELSNVQQNNINFTQYYSQQTLWDKISPIDKKLQTRQISGSNKIYSNNTPSVFKVTNIDNTKGLFFNMTPIPDKTFKYTGDAYDQTTGEKINLANTSISRTHVDDKSGFIGAFIIGNPYKFYIPNDFDPTKTELATSKINNGENRLAKNKDTGEIIPINEAESKINTDNLRLWEVQDNNGNYVPATIKSEGATKRENHFITIPIADNYMNNSYLTEGLDPNAFKIKDNYSNEYGKNWITAAKGLASVAKYTKEEKEISKTVKEEKRKTKDGRIAVFDSETKKFLRHE